MTPTPKVIATAERIADELFSRNNQPLQWQAGERAALAAIMETSEKAAKYADDQKAIFGSNQYATGQPASSFGERFACGKIAEAVLNGEHLK